VVIPCHNEAITIGKVVADFRAALPTAEIIVVDNASKDRTAEVAEAAGARVVYESRPGKGFALVTGFRQVPDADRIVMVDGDDTYPAEDVGKLLAAAERDADMAIGTRLSGDHEKGAFARGHGLGNRLFIFLVRLLFGVRTRDLFSGYRVLTRRFVEHCPLIAQGFEIETELSLQALVGGFRVAEVPIRYRARAGDSASKLRTLRDGYRILLALLASFRDYRPFTLFGIMGAAFFTCSLMSGGVVIVEYLSSGQILRVPLAILSVGLALLAAICVIGGIILSSISRRSAELAALVSRRNR
jgi:glycosyltransferase involved in cell wall biosynthesis